MLVYQLEFFVSAWVLLSWDIGSLASAVPAHVPYAERDSGVRGSGWGWENQMDLHLLLEIQTLFQSLGLHADYIFKDLGPGGPVRCLRG